MPASLRSLKYSMNAADRYFTSVAARFSPLAPVGGTMCPASPARNSRPKRSGSTTKLRSGAMLFSMDGPVTRRSAASGSSRRRNSSQNASSLHCAELVGERHLQVVAAARATAHRAQREAALAVHVDQLLADRRRLGQHAQPAEGIYLLVFARGARRQAGAAHAMETVATGDEIAVDALRRAVPAKRDVGMRAVEAADCHVLRLVEGGQARGVARLHQVARESRSGHRPSPPRRRSGRA